MSKEFSRSIANLIIGRYNPDPNERHGRMLLRALESDDKMIILQALIRYAKRQYLVSVLSINAKIMSVPSPQYAEDVDLRPFQYRYRDQHRAYLRQLSTNLSMELINLFIRLERTSVVQANAA